MLLVIAGMLMAASELPAGPTPPPAAVPYFPDRLHTYVWRNWQVVPIDRMARTIGAEPSELLRIGKAMGLADPPAITADQQRRSYITVIRRNWHLLPYEQLLELLGWTEDQLAYTLREDDFLYIKLGSLKPQCERLQCAPPGKADLAREKEIAKIVRAELPRRVGTLEDPLFGFVAELSQPVTSAPVASAEGFDPRFCSSYFALYGDPLLEEGAKGSYPDGYLARLAQAGVSGVWLQGVLYKLAPYPWDPALSDRYEERLSNLRDLVARARRYGIGVYLYLNEPRAMPLTFFTEHPELKGVVEGDHAAVCTSAPEVQAYLSDAVATICKAAPDLAGFFTISASENLTNCWSHGQGAQCPRCSKRRPAEVIAELHARIEDGIHRTGVKTRLIAWDWGWQNEWAEQAIRALPQDTALMSVSEWDIPIQRGGIDSSIGEYSISVIGPGPRATRHWDAARQRGLKTVAKIQAGNTWELSAVPYIPAVENVARHAANLRGAGVDGLMLGWSLGGYPSPNLEVVSELGQKRAPGEAEVSVDQAMATVATRRYGARLAPAVVESWRRFSKAFSEFPFNGGLVYCAPLQMGPANPLWGEASGYHATMVGFPYDDLDAWRTVYPAEVFIGQFTKIADGFDAAIDDLKKAVKAGPRRGPEAQAIGRELNVDEAAAIHFRSVANQARFVAARRVLEKASDAAQAKPTLCTLETILREEIGLARRLYEIQTRDSRIGFEASNQYYYVPLDLAEKVVNCRDLLDRWLPSQRARFGT